MNIGAAGDDDWFSFTTIAEGSIDHYVKIDFLHSLGDLDLELYDANGHLIQGSRSVNNQESISLLGQSAARYYVRIYGFAGATNPEYHLSLFAPEEVTYLSDWAEDNDTQQTSYNLFQVTGWNYWDELNVDPSGDDDWFVFTTIGTSHFDHHVSIDFLHSLGDLDLELYDANGSLIQGSYSVTNQEHISLHGLGADAYFIRILGNQGATNPDYQLTIFAPAEETFLSDWAEENDTRQTAYNLQVVTGWNDWDELNVDPSGDDDWFSFTTVGTSHEDHHVSIHFLHSLGDLDLELYDANGAPVGGFYGNSGSYGAGNIEHISLQGLEAGTYLIRILGNQGATNPDYELTIFAPEEETLLSDWAEDNDTREAAYNLRTVAGWNYWHELNVDPAGDDDWFVFTTIGSSYFDHHVSIDFLHSLGDLDLELYDINGSLIQGSYGATNQEHISLQGLEAGNYFIRILGNQGATNPDYELTIFAPEEETFLSDWAEDNDTREASYNLRTVAGWNYWHELNVDPAGDDDWFVFTTIGSSYFDHHVSIDFLHSLGDLDLELYDTNGSLIQGSYGATNQEQISLHGLAADNYFIRILGNQGATNPDYELTIFAPEEETFLSDWAEDNDTREAAYNLRILAGQHHWRELNVDPSGDDDWFVFTTINPGSGTNAASIDFLHSLGDLDLELYDANGSLIQGSYGVTDREHVSMEGLPADSYFLRVFGDQGATNPDYQLTILAPERVTDVGDWAEVNDTLGTAYDLKDVEGKESWDELSIHRAGSHRDVIRIGVDATGRWNGGGGSAALPDGSPANARQVYNGGSLVNGNAFRSFRGAIDTLGYELVPLSQFDTIALANLDALIVEQPTRTDDPWSLSEIDAIESFVETGHGLFVMAEGAWSNLAVNLNSLSTRFGVTYADAGSEGSGYGIDALRPHPVTTGVGGVVVDYQRRLVDISLPARDLTFGEGADDFMAVVDGENGSGNVVFISDSEIFKDAYSATQDASIGSFGNRQLLNNVLRYITPETPGDIDWFRFEMIATGQQDHRVSVTFEPGYDGLDLALFDEHGTLLRESSGGGDRHDISLVNLPAGTYYARIVADNGGLQPRYELTIKAPEEFVGDWAEVNNSLLTSYDLRRITGEHTWRDLSIDPSGDDDWFRFETSATSSQSHYVRTSFEHSHGDIDMTLYDANGTMLHQAVSLDDEELISLSGQPAGTYYVHVFGFSNSVNPNYQLAISAPGGLDPDWAEPNNSRGVAHSLRQVQGVQRWDGLSIHSVDDEDWFQFELVADANGEHHVQVFTVGQTNSVSTRLYSEPGNLLRTGQVHGNTSGLSLAGLSQGTYYLEIIDVNQGIHPDYTLQLSTPEPVSTQDHWTIMLYMTASDLAPFAADDINELEYAAAQLPDTVNLMVLWDQSATMATFATHYGNQPPWGTVGRAQVEADRNLNTVATEFEILPELNTGDPEVLTGFIDWSVSNAPAEHYALIMWDHGSGLAGSNFDLFDIDQVNDHLTLQELSSALESPNVPALDIVSFDACLMSMAEVADHLAQSASILVSSEEVVSVEGYDYTTLFQVLMESDYVSASDLATGFVESYGQALNPMFSDWNTQSAIDLTRLDSVWDDLKVFTTAALNGNEQEWDRLSVAAFNATRFQRQTFADLGSFLFNVSEDWYISSAIRNAADEVLASLDEAIIAKTDGPRFTSGVSIFLPGTPFDFTNDYAGEFSDFNEATNWWPFVERLLERSNQFGMGGDWASPNRSAVESYSLGRLNGAGHVFSNLSISPEQGDDWFRIEVGPGATQGNHITVASNEETLPLGIQVYDSSLGLPLLDSGLSDTPSEVDLANLDSGQYVVRVFSLGEDTAGKYSILVDAPPLAPIPSISRNIEKAESLGMLPASRVLASQSYESGSESWYSFQTPRLNYAEDRLIHVRIPGATQEVTVRLIDEADAVVVEASGTGILTLRYIATGRGETYRLQIRDAATQVATQQPVSFHLAFESNRLPTVEGLPATLKVKEDFAPFTIPLTSISAGLDELQDVQFDVTHDNLSLINQPGIQWNSSGATAQVTVTPIANSNGFTTVSLELFDAGADGNFATIHDNQSIQATLALEVEPVNDAPIAAGGTFQVMENSTFVKEQFVTDIEGSDLLFTVKTPLSHGELVFNKAGSFQYVPNENFNRSDSFEYQVSDGEILSDVHTVNIEIDTVYPWYNGIQARDVNDDQFVTPLDVLWIINRLNTTGSHELSTSRDEGVVKPYLDVTRDQYMSPLDALFVINYLNRQSTAGEPEAEGEWQAAANAALMATDFLSTRPSVSNPLQVKPASVATSLIDATDAAMLDNIPYSTLVDEAIHSFSLTGRFSSSADVDDSADEEQDALDLLVTELAAQLSGSTSRQESGAAKVK